LRDPGVSVDRGQQEQESGAAEQRGAGQPDRPERQARRQHVGHQQSKPALEDVGQKAELREAVGLL